MFLIATGEVNKDAVLRQLSSVVDSRVHVINGNNVNDILAMMSAETDIRLCVAVADACWPMRAVAMSFQLPCILINPPLYNSEAADAIAKVVASSHLVFSPREGDKIVFSQSALTTGLVEYFTFAGHDVITMPSDVDWVTGVMALANQMLTVAL